MAWAVGWLYKITTFETHHGIYCNYDVKISVMIPYNFSLLTGKLILCVISRNNFTHVKSVWNTQTKMKGSLYLSVANKYKDRFAPKI